jgi:hypothetical protein
MPGLFKAMALLRVRMSIKWPISFIPLQWDIYFGEFGEVLSNLVAGFFFRRTASL